MVKEFKLRITSDVSDLEKQFKGAASELAKMIKNVGTAEDKFDVLKDAAAYLSQIDKQLSSISSKYPDVFNKIFGSIDQDITNAIDPILKMPDLMSDSISKVGKQLQSVLSGAGGTNDDFKEIANSMILMSRALGKNPPDLNFLDGTSNATDKANKLLDVLTGIIQASYSVHDSGNKISSAIDRIGASAGNATSELDKLKRAQDFVNKTLKSLKGGQIFSSEDILGEIKNKDDPKEVYEYSKKIIQTYQTLAKEVSNIKEKMFSGGELNFDEYKKIIKYGKAASKLGALNKVSSELKLSGQSKGHISSLAATADTVAEIFFEQIQKSLNKRIKSYESDNLLVDTKTTKDKKVKSTDNVNSTQELTEAYKKLNKQVQEYVKLKEKLSTIPDDDEDKRYEVYDKMDKIANKISKEYKVDADDIQDKLYNAIGDEVNDVETAVKGSMGALKELFGTKFPKMFETVQAQAKSISSILPTSDGLKQSGVIVGADQKAQVGKLAEEYRVILTLLEKGDAESKSVTDSLKERASTIKKIIQDIKPIDMNLGDLLKKTYDIPTGTANYLTSAKIGQKFKIDSFNSKNITEETRQKAVDLIYKEIAAENQLIQKKKEEVEASSGDTREVSLEREKQLTQELAALKEKLNAIPTNPVDEAELNDAKNKLQELQKEVDSWKNSYDELHREMQRGSSLDGYTSDDVVDSYREKIDQLYSTISTLNEKLAETETKLSEVQSLGKNAADVDGILPKDSAEGASKIKEETEAIKEQTVAIEQNNTAQQQSSSVQSDVSLNEEYQSLEALREKLETIKNAVNDKTAAFNAEKEAVSGNVTSEILELDKLKGALQEILNSLQNINKTGLNFNVEQVKSQIDEIFAKLTNPSYKNEYLGLLNSKTGKVSDEYFEGTGSRVEGKFKNKKDYDTMFHNHPDVSTAIPGITDWETFLSEFNNFRRQIILTKDEIATFDLSQMTRQELSELVNAIKSELSKAKYDKELVKDTEQYGKDEAIQRWTKRTTMGVLAQHSNLQMSTKPVTQNTTATNASSSTVQAEIEVLNSLEKKIFDIKHAIEEKNSAFVNEKQIVDSVVAQEIASLDTLLAKINEIKGAVDIKTEAFKSEGSVVTESVKQATKIKEEIKKKDTFDTEKEKLIDVVSEYEKSLSGVQFIPDDALNKVSEMQTKLKDITNSNDLAKWKSEWDLLTESIESARKEQEELIFEKQKNQLTGIKNTLSNSYKGAKIDATNVPEELQEVKTGYEDIVARINTCIKQRKILTEEEVAGFAREAATIKQVLDAYTEKTKVQTKNSSAYGSAFVKNATNKYDRLYSIATNDEFGVSPAVVAKAQELKSVYEQIVSLNKSFANTNPSEEQRIAFNRLTDEFNETYSALDKIIKSSRKLAQSGSNIFELYNDGKTEFDLSSEEGRMTALKEAVNFMSEGKAQIGEFNKECTALNYTVKNSDGTFTEFTARINEAGTAIVETTGKTQKSTTMFGRFFDELKRKARGIATYLISITSFQRVWQEIRQGITYIKEIDSALTELKKVTDETDETYEKFLDTASKVGSEIGSTISDFTNATADFARLGYSIEEATKLAEAASIYKNVGDGIDSVSQATESIISTMKAFGIEAENSMSIVDKFNEVGNNFAISSTGIGEALQRSASALYESGNTLDESIALITAANSVIQNPEQVGTALKTLSLRLRGAKVELEEAGEDVDGMADSVSSLQEKLLALTHGKVNIMADASTFKNTTQILREMSDAWEDMTDIERSAALELMGGKRQANILASIIKNYDTVDSVIEASINSQNSAYEENLKWMDSIEGRINKFTNALQSMWKNAINSDAVKNIISFGTAIVELIDKVGLLPSILTAASAALSAFKGQNLFFNLNKDSSGTLGIITELIQKLKEGSPALKEFNSIQGVENQAKFLNSLKETNPELAKYITKIMSASSATTANGVATNIASASQAGYTKSLIASKIATIALNVATVALNAALTMGISLLVSGLITAVSNWINKTKEEKEETRKLTEELKQQQSQIKSNISSLESLKDEFDELSKGVDEYGNNISLSTEEYAKYKSIVEEILGYTPTLISGYDKEGNAIANKNGLIEKSIELLKEERKQKLLDLVTDDKLKASYDTAKESYNSAKKRIENIKMPSSLAQSGVKIDENGKESTGYNNQVDKYIEDVIGVKKSIWESIPEYIARNYDAVRKNIGAILKRSGETKDGWKGLDEGQQAELLNYLNNVLSGVREADSAWNSFIQTLQLVPELSDYYDDLSDSQKSFISSYVNSLGDLSSKTEDEINKIKPSILSLANAIGDSDVAKDLIDQLFSLDSSLSAKEYANRISEIFTSLVNEGIISDETKEKITEQMFPDLDSIENMQEKIKESIQEGQKDAIDGLNMSDLKVAYQVVMELDQGSLLSFNQMLDAIERKKAEAASFDISNYATSIESITGNISTFQGALSALESGTFSMSDFIGLLQQFPDIAKGVSVANGKFIGLDKNLRRLIKDSPKSLIADLKKLREQLKLVGKDTSAIDALIDSMENLPIDAISDLGDEYLTLADNINAAKKAQTELEKAMGEDTNTEYTTYAEGYAKMQELMEKGAVGSESKLWKIAETIVGKDDPIIIQKDADALWNLIEARKSWYDGATEDGYSYDGISNFLEYVSQQEDVLSQFPEVIWEYENGLFTMKLPNDKWDEFAKSLHMTSEEFTALMWQAAQFHQIRWENVDDLSSYLDKMAESGYSAKDRLDDLERSLENMIGKSLDGLSRDDLKNLLVSMDMDEDSVNRLLDKYDQLKIEISEDPLSIKAILDQGGEDVLSKLSNIAAIKDSINKTGDITFFDEQSLRSQMSNAGYAQTTIDQCVASIKELQGVTSISKTAEDPLGLSGIISNAEDAATAVKETTALLQGFEGVVRSFNEGEIAVSVTDLYQKLKESNYSPEKIQEYFNKLSENGFQFTIDGENLIDDSALKKKLKELSEEKTNLPVTPEISQEGSDAIETWRNEQESNPVKVTVEAQQDQDSFNNVEDKKNQLKETTSYNVEAKSDQDSVNGIEKTKKGLAEPVHIPVFFDIDKDSEEIIQEVIKDEYKKILLYLDEAAKKQVKDEIADIVKDEKKKILPYMDPASVAQCMSTIATLTAPETKTITVNVVYNDPGWSGGGSPTGGSPIGRSPTGGSPTGGNSTKYKDKISQLKKKKKKKGINVADGTAHASGNWGLPQAEHNSLVGELGPETVVDPHTGRYYTVGDNGAEIVDLPKDAIIFNHLQTEQLFKNGHINSRGQAYISGTAHSETMSGFNKRGGSQFVQYTFSSSAASDIASAASAMEEAEEQFEEVFDWFEILLEEINAQLDLMNAKLENAVGIKDKESIISQLLSGNHYKLDELSEGLKLYTDYANKLLAKIPSQYKKMSEDGAVYITEFYGDANEDVVEAIKNYREWAEKVQDLNQQLEETRKEISSLRVQTMDMINTEYDNEIGLITNVNDRIQDTMDFLEESGKRVSGTFYDEMIKNSTKQLDKLKEQRIKMQDELDEAVKSGDVKKFSEDWYEMVNAIYDVDASIIECETDIEEFQNAILDLHWDNFEKIIDAIDAISDEAEQLRDLIDDDDIADDVGNWTRDGIAALGLVAEEMEKAKYRAELYGKEIEQLNKDYAAGKYSTDEYNEKLKDLKDSQWDSIDAYESAKKAIIDLNKTRIEAVKDGIQKEIDAYEKLISKRKEDLSAQKDAHDFNKTVQDQQKEIDKIQRQIDAMEGDTSAAAIAKRKKLQEELYNAQQELAETYYDHDIETQQNALDKELEAYRQEKEDRMEELDNYLKNEEQVLADSLQLILGNADGISAFLKDIEENYGISIYSSVVDPWNDGADALAKYLEMLKAIKGEQEDLQLEADKTASALLDTINKSASSTTSAEYVEPPKPEPKPTPTKPSRPRRSGGGSSSSSSSVGVGSTVTVKDSATNFAKDGGNGTRMQSWVPGSSFTVMETSGNKVLIGIPGASGGQYTGWVDKKDLVGYAKGTTGVKKSQLARIDEGDLEELVLHADGNGRLAFLSKGTSVIPADITENLMKLGSIDPTEMLKRSTPSIGAPHIINNNMELNMEFGSLVHVDNCTQDAIPELQKMVRSEFDNMMKQVNNGLKRYAR